MLLGFFYTLREFGVPVGLNEWMALLEALKKGLHQSSLTGFYHLDRSLLVHTEAHFDAYDQAFSKYFKGIEAEAKNISDELEQWLKDPAMMEFLSEEQKAALKALSLDELHELFEQRLREQKERHQGGSRWIGTGGTSPFGAGGYHPSGVRLGDMGGGRSAAQVAAQRRFRDYRSDLVLDVRQIKMALRKLRQLRREGRDDELALSETVDRTCRNAGELELVWRPPRKNNVRLILMMDVGGSMDPYARVVSRLFSAAHQSKHFRSFTPLYFHNCIYDKVYKNGNLSEQISVAELLRTTNKSHKLVVVGDALMHPLELVQPGGAIDFWFPNRTPGIDWLRLLTDHFERKVWLNPEPQRYWNHPTIDAIAGLFPMFPLTLAGLDDAVTTLIKGRRPHRMGEPTAGMM